MTNIAGLHPTPMDTCGRRRRSRMARLPARFVAPCMAMNQADLIKALRAYDASSGRTVRPACSCSARALGTERPDRDFDLFIDYDADAKIPNLFRLMQIEDEITKALGIAVTITTRDALHPSMRESIEQDALRVSKCRGTRRLQLATSSPRSQSCTRSKQARTFGRSGPIRLFVARRARLFRPYRRLCGAFPTRGSRTFQPRPGVKSKSSAIASVMNTFEPTMPFFGRS